MASAPVPAWIGTSGFQYPEWKGKWYPADLSAAKMLGYYAERFTSTESNYSFRCTPSLKTIEKWREGTPERFRFSFKAPQKITHFARLRDCAEAWHFFREAIAPMGEKLGVVLFQLPPTFRADGPLLQEFLAMVAGGPRVAFEFRHESWFTEATWAALREAGAALCVAEDEERRTPPEVTAPFGYLRLRREDYTPAQVRKWAQWIRAQTEWQEVFLYSKHEEQAVGPRFAEQWLRLLSEG